MEQYSSASRLQHRPRAFTVVELLVVIVIIMVLVGLLMVVVSRSYGTSRRVRVQADLQTIALGLEAYKQDFGDYPRPTGTDGAMTLSWALVAPGGAAMDGADGPGFRLRATGQGKVYGPYVDASKFDLTGGYLRDRVMATDPTNNPPILYIPARPAVSTQQTITPQQAYAGVDNVPPGTRYVFNLFQCGTWIFGPAWLPPCGPNPPLLDATQQIQAMLGDTNANGAIDGNERAACTVPYILWAPGADGQFGLRYEDGRYVTDDVANFDFDSGVLVK